MADLQFYDDPATFLEVARPFLAAAPVLTTVVSTVTDRAAAGSLPPGPHPRWWLAVVEGADVVGVAMRTAPGASSPPYLTSMPDDAALALARALAARGEQLDALNGALPAARLAANEYARLTGTVATAHERTRLYVLGELVEPQGVAGRLRPATTDDLDLALDLFDSFERLAAEQAGRPVPDLPLEPVTVERVRQRIEQGCVWWWCDETGRPVSLTAANPPAHGATRIGPVITPPEHRRRGYASAAVAAVSRELSEAGHQVCLFTDQANATSNHIYQEIGYRPLVDMVNMSVTRPAQA